MIVLFYCNSGGQWQKFDTLAVKDLDVDLLWITNINGFPQLTSYGCNNTNGINGELFYYQLTNTQIFQVARIYMNYTVNGKDYTKKSDGIADGKTKRIYIPIEADFVVVKIQEWFFGWKDLSVIMYEQNKNRCFVTRDEKTGMSGMEVKCSD